MKIIKVQRDMIDLNVPEVIAEKVVSITEAEIMVASLNAAFSNLQFVYLILPEHYLFGPQFR